MSRSTKLLVVLLVLVSLVGAVATANAVMSFAREAAGPIKIFTDALAIVHSKYVEEVSIEDLVYGALDGMLVNLDPHSSFMRPDAMRELAIDTSGKFEGLGIEISIRDNFIMIISPIDGTPASEAGLKTGDYIVKIEGQSTRGMSLIDAVKLLRGPAGSSVKIQVWRKEWQDPRDFELVRAPIEVASVSHEELEPGYGYVKVRQFSENTSANLRKAIKALEKTDGGLKGVVIDLRNDPGGLLDEAVRVCDLFVSEGLIVYTRGRDESQGFNATATKAGTFENFPITLLINAGSASASEIVAGCLQDHHRAIIIGERSFGKGSVQSIVPLSDGSGLRLTTAKYYTPAGRDIQAKGIEPDLVVSGDEFSGLDDNKRELLREADLERHLQGADEEAAPADQEGPVLPPVDDGGDTTAAPKKPGDPQLDMALRVLKAWPAFSQAAQGAE